MKLWLLEPGWIRSPTDGDRHYISAPTLARIYGLRIDECIVATTRESHGYDEDYLAVLHRFIPSPDGLLYRKITEEERIAQIGLITRYYERKRKDRETAYAAAQRWKGIPVKDENGRTIGQVIDAKVVYEGTKIHHVEMTSEVEPDVGRRLFGSLDLTNMEFSVGPPVGEVWND
jgi:hypothetical protein